MNRITSSSGEILAEWNDEVFEIGTQPPETGLKVKDNACAPHHFTIITRDEKRWVQSMEGRVFLNDREVTRQWIEDGDTLLIGQTTLTFNIDDDVTETETINTQMPHLRLVESGKIITIIPPQITLGSTSKDPRIPAILALEPEHLKVGITENGIWFRDITDDGRVWLNGQPVSEGWLNPGDNLRVTDVDFTFGSQGGPTPPPLPTLAPEGPPRHQPGPSRLPLFIIAGVILVCIIAAGLWFLLKPDRESAPPELSAAETMMENSDGEMIEPDPSPPSEETQFGMSEEDSPVSEYGDEDSGESSADVEYKPEPVPPSTAKPTPQPKPQQKPEIEIKPAVEETPPPPEAAPSPEPEPEEKLSPEEKIMREVRQKILDRMVTIPGGKFNFGKLLNMRKLKRTRSVEAFKMDLYEITVGEYALFLEATGHPQPPRWNPNADSEARSCPVTWVSFEDAYAFARWVGMELPTELQWEYAARPEGNHSFPWGNRESPLANVKEAGFARPLPVGHYSEDRSRFGIYDVVGNVSEWTLRDYDHPKEMGKEGKKNGQVIRGGHFARDLRKSKHKIRYINEVTGKRPDVGFRLILNE